MHRSKADWGFPSLNKVLMLAFPKYILDDWCNHSEERTGGKLHRKWHHFPHHQERLFSCNRQMGWPRLKMVTDKCYRIITCICLYILELIRLAGWDKLFLINFTMNISSGKFYCSVSLSLAEDLKISLRQSVEPQFFIWNMTDFKEYLTCELAWFYFLLLYFPSFLPPFLLFWVSSD